MKKPMDITTHIAPQSYLTRFQKLLQVVLQTNTFYRKKFSRAGITRASQIRSWSDYFSLPITSRQELMDDQEKHPPFGTNLTRPETEYTYVINTSGTSTGKPFYSPLTNNEFNRFANVMAEGNRQLGIKKNDVFCHLVLPYAYPLVYEAAVRRIGVRLIIVEATKPLDLLLHLRKMRVTVLQTIPTVLFQLIEIAREYGIDLRDIGIRKLITIGEIGGGHPPTKALFEKEWSAKVLDHIGSIESATLAVVCPKTNDYHLLNNFFIVEVFDPKSNQRTTRGELVLTSLWRKDFPIIRYRTGDMVEIDYSPCKCGKNTPRLIRGILGRITGQIKVGAIFMFPEEFELILKNYTRVIDYRIVCIKKHGVDTVNIFLELPLTVPYSYIESIQQTIMYKMGVYAQIIPLFPKTLPRFGAKKSKRFYDHRTDPNASSLIPLTTQFGSKLFYHLLIMNSRKEKLFNLFNLLLGNLHKS